MTSCGSKSKHNRAKTLLQAPFQPRQVSWWRASIKWSWTNSDTTLQGQKPTELESPCLLENMERGFITSSIIDTTFVPIYFSRNYWSDWLSHVGIWPSWQNTAAYDKLSDAAHYTFHLLRNILPDLCEGKQPWQVLPTLLWPQLHRNQNIMKEDQCEWFSALKYFE